MPNLVHVEYDQTGKSKSTNALGMREMQEKAYEGRTAQYLLLKAPPASGKSRALMFLGLDKLFNQGVKKGAIRSDCEPRPLQVALTTINQLGI